MQQTNGTDCGPITLFNAEMLLKNEELFKWNSTAQINMKSIRKQQIAVLEIYKSGNKIIDALSCSPAKSPAKSPATNVAKNRKRPVRRNLFAP